MTIIDLDLQLREHRENFALTAPAGRLALYEAKLEELRSTFARSTALREGDRAPDFALLDAKGGVVSLSSALACGPAVGPSTEVVGASTAISSWGRTRRCCRSWPPLASACWPSRPSFRTGHCRPPTAERESLTFDVLSDVGNDVARRFGLVYRLPQEAVPGINGDDSWELPVPATYVIAQNQRILLAFIEIDYRQRLAPQQLLDALREQQRS